MKKIVKTNKDIVISDGIQSLEYLFHNDSLKLIQHVIKNCLFFHPNLVYDRSIEIRDNLNIIKDKESFKIPDNPNKILPVRRSNKKFEDLIKIGNIIQ